MLSLQPRRRKSCPRHMHVPCACSTSTTSQRHGCKSRRVATPDTLLLRIAAVLELYSSHLDGLGNYRTCLQSHRRGNTEEYVEWSRHPPPRAKRSRRALYVVRHEISQFTRLRKPLLPVVCVHCVRCTAAVVSGCVGEQLIARALTLAKSHVYSARQHAGLYARTHEHLVPLTVEPI